MGLAMAMMAMTLHVFVIILFISPLCVEKIKKCRIRKILRSVKKGINDPDTSYLNEVIFSEA